MFAKIKDGELLYISQIDNSFLEKINEEGEKEIISNLGEGETMIELTEEEHKIIQNGGKYIDGKFVEREITKQEKINKINSDFEQKVKEQITAGYTDYEVKTWDKKVAEAEKVLAGGTSPLLEALIIDKEKTSVKDFAKLIIQKANEKFVIYAELEKEKNIALKELEK